MQKNITYSSVPDWAQHRVVVRKRPKGHVGLLAHISMCVSLFCWLVICQEEAAKSASPSAVTLFFQDIIWPSFFSLQSLSQEAINARATDWRANLATWWTESTSQCTRTNIPPPRLTGRLTILCSTLSSLRNSRFMTSRWSLSWSYPDQIILMWYLTMK